MTNTELVKQLRTASIQCDEMRLKDFGYLFKTAAEKIDELLGSVETLHNLTDMLMECVPQWNEHTIDGGTVSNIPHSYDGKWIIVTDGNSISVERIKKDAYDHFFPAGRWFSLDKVTHWMPLPNPPAKGREE